MATSTTTPSTQGSIPVPPQPPRMTGDVEADVKSIAYWLNQFYQYAFLQNAVLTVEGQSQAGTFDPTTLPDPASSTVAKAQDTANRAFILANAGKVESDGLLRRVIASGQFTVIGAATSPAAVLPLPVTEPDLNYQVIAMATGSTGAPVTSSLIVSSVAKTTTTFLPTLAAAPGAGNSVTFDYFVVRNS